MKRKLLTMLLAVCVMAGTAVNPIMGMNVQAEENAVEAVGEVSGDFEYQDDTYEYNDPITGEIKKVERITIIKYHGSDTDVVIPAEIAGKPVRTIISSAFNGCSSLRNITIPDSVTSISGSWGDMSIFGGCNNLRSINVDENNSYYSSVSGVLYDKEQRTLFRCPAEKTGTYQIPDSVTSIGEWAFEDCSSLSNITIPDSVTSIGAWAFFGCSNISSITIPNSVMSIVNNTFMHCNSLSSITIPNSVTSIGDAAFSDCSSLSSITIPNSVTSIGDDAFHGCSNLSRIKIPDGVTSIGRGMFYECCSLSDITIPDSVTSIEDVAFHSCSSLSSITLPDSVTSIGDYAFQGCRNLISITIPSDVTGIGMGMFYECPSLNSITIPNRVTSIEGYTFWGCSSLSNIMIPNSITSIGYRAFENCNRLENVYYNGSKEEWTQISVDSGNSELHNAVIHCSDGDIIPTKTPSITPLNTNNVQLTTTKVTYNGKAQTPAVTVKDNQGKVIANTNYTVQYTNNQNVGQASVTVTFKGSYSGTVTKTFEIVPAGTKISKITAKKKGFTVKWKKQAVQTTGYEIQYSTSNKFKGAKTAGNIKAKKTSQTISKLKAKKKYYVRIRTYKTVGGKNYYSDWSAAKNIKTKK